MAGLRGHTAVGTYVIITFNPTVSSHLRHKGTTITLYFRVYQYKQLSQVARIRMTSQVVQVTKGGVRQG